MTFKDIFTWDGYSDQPHVIRDKTLRRRIYRSTLVAQLKLLLTNAALLPLIILRFSLSFMEKKTPSSEHFFGMSINYDKAPQQTKALIEELGVRRLLIRLPLSEMHRFDAYVTFIAQFKDYDLLINILQDREHVEDLTLLHNDLQRIFSTLVPLTCQFQIGNAVNRKKWAFFSMDEYLQFYEVAQKLKQQHYPQLVLIGSSVIDFEYHYSVRTLFNFYRVHYDIFSALLYVDRRGAPENRQMGLNLSGKIRLLYSIMALSAKTAQRLIITETNWPRTQSAPYAPTSEKECVDDVTYAAYMVRYYLIALASGRVESVYWHQLIAPGYGLVDHREGIKKYRAFDAFATMLHFIDGARAIALTSHQNLYRLTCHKETHTITVLWSQQQQTQSFKDAEVYSMTGKRLESTEVTISQNPIYVISKDRQ